MAKNKKVEVPEEEILDEEPKEVEEKKEVIVKAPEATGKFFTTAVKGGYVIINPNGQVVSKPMPQAVAEDKARRFNR